MGAAGALQPRDGPWRPSGLVTLLTDFGTEDAYVGIMKGVLHTICPALGGVVDLTHGLAAQDVRAASFHLAHAWRWFPAGTVHVAVVDPGVGSDRRILVARDGGHVFLAPDNGLLGPVVSDAAELWVLDVERFGLSPRSKTFHGRDVFAPAAGRFAGGLDPAGAGPPAGAWDRPQFPEPGPLEGGGWRGEVLSADRFGNLITNLSPDLLGGVAAGWALEVGGRRAPLHGTYADAKPGELLALVDSYGLLEISVQSGSAADRLELGAGAPVELVRAGDR